MRNCAFCPTICRKACEPPGAICVVLYRSRGHRMATRHRTDFNILHESSMNSNGFRLCDDRVCISPRAHPAPKFAFWYSKNSGFVVSTMSPGMHRCCHRRPRIIHRRRGWWPPTQSWPQIGPTWEPSWSKIGMVWDPSAWPRKSGILFATGYGVVLGQCRFVVLIQ